MRHLFVSLAAAFTLTAAPLLAQTLTIGTNFSGVPDDSDSDSTPVRTVIDSFAPASATGIVTSARVYWSQAGCPNALKVKFFRRGESSLTMIAERGPFTPTSRDFTVTLSPPVAVRKGDLIGVTRLTNCGVPMTFRERDATYYYFPSDVTGTRTGGFNYTFGDRLALFGTGIETEDIVVGIIPVVGSTAGSQGASFKTSLQLLNTESSQTINGKLVFHPASTSGRTFDPTVSYSIGAGQVVSYANIAATFGRTGLGSIDVMTTQTSPRPLIITRVFNDAGPAGTAGLTEEVIDPDGERVINVGSTGFLITPSDTGRTRFNIGVRTLVAGASLTAILRATNGTVIRTITRTYLPNWFEQVDAASFFSGTPVGSNQSIAIIVTSGSAIVYGSTTDNTTNDPNIQFAAVHGEDTN